MNHFMAVFINIVISLIGSMICSHQVSKNILLTSAQIKAIEVVIFVLLFLPVLMSITTKLFIE